jgi:hypothetical protein
MKNIIIVYDGDDGISKRDEVREALAAIEKEITQQTRKAFLITIEEAQEIA